jgi:hypothetical protein
LQLAVLPVDLSMVQAFPSLQVLGHVVCGSQVSPGSTIRLPHEALQSLSELALQPGAQQPSLLRHCVIDWCVHVAVQLARLPAKLSMVQALPSLHAAAVGQDDAGSQVSPGSTTLLPQVELQSRSLLALQPGAQQPSPLRHWVMAWYPHAAVQLAALPVRVSMVHELPSLQLRGQEPGGSQVSPGSTTLLPQLALQSLSVRALQPGAQQPSPLTHWVMDWWPQVAVQFMALPTKVSMVQAVPSLHAVGVGQDAAGSQVSPGSTTLLPQLALQSLSLTALQPEGQQPSPLRHWEIV